MDVGERAHQNLCDFTRFQARLDSGSELLDEAGVVAVAGSVDFPTAASASDRVERFRPRRGPTP